MTTSRISELHRHPPGPRAAELTDKVAVVTGTANGIGRGIAFELAAHGAALVLTDLEREASALAAVAAEISAAGGRVSTRLADLGDAAASEQVVAGAIETYGRIDLLVNNASAWSGKDYWSPKKRQDESTPADWERVFCVNLVGTMFLSRRVAAEMHNNVPDEAGCRGAIVQITSIHDSRVRLHHIEYALSKAAQAMLVKELAVLLAPDGIRVNGIAPGDIRVRETADVDAGIRAENPYVPLGKASGLPWDVARAVVLLASSYWSPYTTGAILAVDGGLQHFNHLVHYLDPGSGKKSGGVEALRPSADNDPDR